MATLAYIEHEEAVRIDPGRIGILADQLGPDTARNVVERATEELTVRLMQLCAANAGENLDAVQRLARSVAATADQLGMVTLARVARDVALCAARSDRTAFRATFARLRRIAEICLIDQWYITDRIL